MGWTAIALRWFMLFSTVMMAISILFNIYISIEKMIKENKQKIKRVKANAS